MSELADSVAREVMEFQDGGDRWYTSFESLGEECHYILKREWSPDTRWDHAGMLVDKMREDGWSVKIWYDDFDAEVRLKKPLTGVYGNGDGPNLPYAITVAALAAKRAERGET